MYKIIVLCFSVQQLLTMSSEAQRLIGLSLNKIISSRSRRGGISLHRNLLVASVLLKARDVYVADTAAAKKLRSISDDVVVAVTNEEQERPQEVPQSRVSDSGSSDAADDEEEDMDTSDLQFSSSDVVVSDTSASNDDFVHQDYTCAHVGTRSVDVVTDSDDEQCKENISPLMSSIANDTQLSLSNTNASNNSVITCKRKRMHPEVELVANIAGSRPSDLSENQNLSSQKRARTNSITTTDSLSGNRTPLSHGLQTSSIDDTSRHYNISSGIFSSSNHTLLIATM